MNNINLRQQSTERRGLVLVLVLVIMLFAIWTASVLVSTAQVQAGSTSIAEQQARSHAILLSGIEVVAEKLQNQRTGIRAGDSLHFEDEYVLFSDQGRHGIIRLLPVAPDGSVFRNEATCLDINHVTADQLLKTGLVEPEIANAIVSRRGSIGTYGSISELLTVDGVTPECLYGEIGELDFTSQAIGQQQGLGERILDRLEVSLPRGLADVVTVYACEPMTSIQGGSMINLSDGWSSQIEGELSDLLKNEKTALIKSVVQRQQPKNDGVFAQMLASELPPNELANIMDLVTCEKTPNRLARIDINHASPLVLEAFGILEADQLQQVIDRRDELDEASRLSPLWPYVLGAIRQDQLADFFNRATTHGLAYRFILAAGEVNSDEPHAQLIEPCIYEVVIDLVDSAPRVAYLRDISLLQTAARLTIQASEATGSQDDQSLEMPLPPAASLPDQNRGLDSEELLNTGVTAFEAPKVMERVDFSRDRPDELKGLKTDETPPTAEVEDGRIGRWRVVD